MAANMPGERLFPPSRSSPGFFLQQAIAALKYSDIDATLCSIHSLGFQGGAARLLARQSSRPGTDKAVALRVYLI